MLIYESIIAAPANYNVCKYCRYHQHHMEMSNKHFWEKDGKQINKYFSVEVKKKINTLANMLILKWMTIVQDDIFDLIPGRKRL